MKQNLMKKYQVNFQTRDSRGARVEKIGVGIPNLASKQMVYQMITSAPPYNSTPSQT